MLMTVAMENKTFNAFTIRSYPVYEALTMKWYGNIQFCYCDIIRQDELGYLVFMHITWHLTHAIHSLIL